MSLFLCQCTLALVLGSIRTKQVTSREDQEKQLILVTQSNCSEEPAAGTRPEGSVQHSAKRRCICLQVYGLFSSVFLHAVERGNGQESRVSVITVEIFRDYVIGTP